MQNNSINLVPVYQNGVLTWAPASHTVQATYQTQNVMGPPQMMQQRHMMEAPSLQGMPRHGVAMPNVTYIQQGHQIPANMVPRKSMMQGNQYYGPPEGYVPGVSAYHGTDIHYGAPVMQHGMGVDGGRHPYASPEFMIRDPSMGNMNMVNPHAVPGSARVSPVSKPSEGAKIMVKQSIIPQRSEGGHSHDYAAQMRSQNFARGMPQPGTPGPMNHQGGTTPNAHPNYMHNAPGPVFLGQPQERNQVFDPATAKNVAYQQMHPGNQYLGHPSQVTLHQSAKQPPGVPSVGYGMQQPVNAAHHNQPITRKVYAPRHPSGIMPPQAAGNQQQAPKAGTMPTQSKDIAIMGGMNNPMNVANSNTVQSPVTFQVPPGNISTARINKDPENLRIQAEMPTFVKSGSETKELKLISGRAPIPHDLQLTQPTKPVTDTRMVFSLDKRWQLRDPEQMIYFEFYISAASYKHMFQFVNTLVPQSDAQSPQRVNPPHMLERNDVQLSMQDNLVIKTHSISEAVIKMLIEKLRTLRCSLLKRHDPRNLIRRSYPEGNCVLYSDLNNYELLCFFGTTKIEDNISLSLYHKLKCEETPDYISRKENRKYKVTIEKQFDILLGTSGYNLQIALRRLADAHERSFQVAFGAKIHSLIDLIVRLFQPTLNVPQ